MGIHFMLLNLEYIMWLRNETNRQIVQNRGIVDSLLNSQLKNSGLQDIYTIFSSLICPIFLKLGLVTLGFSYFDLVQFSSGMAYLFLEKS